MSEPAKPIPRVSAKHYDVPNQEVAKVRFRIKGQSDGPVYQGQRKIIPCKSCKGQ